MPEYPDVEVYVDALRRHAGGRVLERVRVASPFVLRTVTPPIEVVHGRSVVDVRRLGKRVVLGFDGGWFVVIHLMIAGRLRWREPNAALHRKTGLAAFDFDAGTLVFTEAGSKKRASMHVVSGEAGLAELDPGGLEPVTSELDAFRARVRLENRTLKRALTDPRLFAGIGNAYSDEVLHRAGLSPVARTAKLDDDAVERLWRACREVLETWKQRLTDECGDGFPEKVAAFRDDMAVHGRFGKPCPACGAAVQRVRYADNEMNYCPGCQTGGKLLADKALSRLLGSDWPRTLDELESLRGR